LKEADNWTTFSTEIEDAMDNGELEVIAEKLTGIQSSLKILSHVPDFEDRVVLVEGMKNRLEALSSPQLVAAFNADDAEKARFFVKIFASMDRGEQLLKYYRHVAYKCCYFLQMTNSCYFSLSIESALRPAS
jgi:hypothetical protein